MKTGVAILFGIMLMGLRVSAQEGAVDFESHRWRVTDGEIVTHLGRRSLAGTALLKDLKFQNGVIEVDVAVNGQRSYPGLIFRMHSRGNYERVYLRPHRAGLYPDAIQYTPVFSGVAGWQLYHGKGFTAGAGIPAGRWVHLKMEIHGAQARVYLGSADRPALVIDDLKHGEKKGLIGVMGPKDGTAYFSNFRYSPGDALHFDAPPEAEKPGGVITEWEISKPFKPRRINRDRYPRFFSLFSAGWKKVGSDPSGLVDLYRHVVRRGQGPDCILARKIFRSDRGQEVKLTLGYSDEVDVFFNGRKVFSGKSGYRSRDPSFLGIIGLHDAITLRAEKGRNEVLLMVTETFGGWGIMGRTDRPLDPPAREHGCVRKVWETPRVFLAPESVLHDGKRNVLYVTNFDTGFNRSNKDERKFTGFISKVKLNGEVETLKWVTHLNAPCGMTIHQDRLHVVERRNLAEIDLDSGRILRRTPVPDSDFPNDVAVDSEGRIYISDSSPSAPAASRIYRIEGGRIEVWTDSDRIINANGLFLHGNRLLVGNTGDGCLKSIGLEDRRIDTVACLGAGIVDGIRVDGRGNCLVSHWEGQVYRVSPAGRVVEILDTMPSRNNVADFEFIKEKNLLIVPAFSSNKVIAYEVD